MAFENRSDSGAGDACGLPPLEVVLAPTRTYEEIYAAAAAQSPDLLAAVVDAHRAACTAALNATRGQLDRPERAD